MTTPGLIVEELDASPIGGAENNVGRPYIVAEAARGPLGAFTVTDFDAIVALYGAETDYSFLHDAADVLFREGTGELVVSRAVSTTATTSTGSVAGGRLTVTASSPGDWGDDLIVSTLAGTNGGFYILITSDASDLELLRSPLLADALDAKAWSEELTRGLPRLIRVAPGGTSGVPGTTTGVALTGGDDGRPGFNDAAWVAAVNRIPAELGPGTVTVPGITSAAVRAGVADHILAFNRFAALDLPRGSSVSAQITAAEALESASEGARRVELFCQSARVPARRGGTGSRLVPYSVVQAGMAARYFAGNELGDPIANTNGTSVYATSLDRVYTDAERGQLNAGGVSVARVRRGLVQTYSDRVATPSKSPNQVDYAASAGRTIMGIRADLSEVVEDYVLEASKPSVLANATGAVSGVCKTYYDAEALAGATNDDAYEVGVTFDPDSRELVARAEITPSQSIERVRLQVARRAVPTT